MASDEAKAFVGFVVLVAVLALAVFGCAGTLDDWQGWAFLAVFVGASLAITLYLKKHDPALLARRARGGPLAEPTRRQQLIQAVASVAFLASVVVPVLARRFGWGVVPAAVAVVGDAMVALGFAIVFWVFRANSYASATIEVAKEQRVIETGPYAVVRHPMYAGGLLLVAGIPLALGSVAGVVTLPVFAAVLAWRLVDEERVLVEQLPGYAAYRDKTRYRLVPGIW